MSDKVKFTHFKNITDTLVDGIELTLKEMGEKGLLTETTTLDDMAKYAGQNVLISEFGCSEPISFNTSDGVKTMYPGKRYNDNLEEIE